MRGRLLNLSAIARVFGPILFGAALGAAAVLWVEVLAIRPLKVRPISVELKRCAAIQEEARVDAACDKAWGPSRRHLMCLPAPTPSQLHACGR